MMKIKLGKFTIENDVTQFVVYEEKIAGDNTKNPGEIIKFNPGYYATFGAALKSLPNKALLRCDAQSLSEAIQVIESYRDMISDALKDA